MGARHWLLQPAPVAGLWSNCPECVYLDSAGSGRGLWWGILGIGAEAKQCDSQPISPQVTLMDYEEGESVKKPEVERAEETTLAKRLPKIYKIAGIVFGGQVTPMSPGLTGSGR